MRMRAIASTALRWTWRFPIFRGLSVERELVAAQVTGAASWSNRPLARRGNRCFWLTSIKSMKLAAAPTSLRRSGSRARARASVCSTREPHGPDRRRRGPLLGCPP
jgi:hypothetical protein